MKRPIYTIFNIIYQIIICWVLMILNAYYNELIIPESIMHSSGKIAFKILVALLEGAILLSIVYAINRGVLSDTDARSKQKAVANKMAKMQLIVTACFIIVIISS